MTDGMGPYLEPSLLIGLGAWGGAVTEGAEGALRERSPALARACRALALEGATPDLPERLRAHLRVSRLAEVVRALEQEGLMRLDPVVSPASHVYLVASLADDPDLSLLRQVAQLVDAAAAELKAKVVKTAIVDLAGGRLPQAPGFPLYVLEPVTAHGLVLEEGEYQAAATELLVAAAQPGGSQVLAAGRGTGTLGIAWLTWSPAQLHQSLAGSLSREALLRCATAVPPAGRAPDLAAGREEALLARLPFVLGLNGELQSEGPLWGQPTSRRLKRATVVLERKLDRWRGRLTQNTVYRARHELQTLGAAEHQALTAGPDGLARLRATLEATAREAAQRLDAPPATGPAKRNESLKSLRRRLAAAESLPDTPVAAIALGAGMAIFTLIWWLTGGRALSWLGGTAFQLLAFGAYLAWRPWRIRRALHDLEQGLTQRATHAIHQAYHEALTQLDERMERYATDRAAQLQGLTSKLATPPRQDAAQDPTPQGALCFPLVGPGAAAPIYQELQQLLPDMAERLAAAGVLLHWQEPAALTAAAETEVRRLLADRAPLDPARAATRAYGDRLAERLRDLVDLLFEWSQPLLARPMQLPEGRRWLLWPEGLPCPSVPPEVAVLPYAKSCVAVVHVVAGIPALAERKSEETA